MTKTSILYQQVTLITEEYLGPAAERFVARQISFHLDKTPEALTRDDLPKLIEWTRITFSLLTENRQLIDEYIGKIAKLGEQ
jgi:hypothetical protein